MTDQGHLDEQEILDWLSGHIADERREGLLAHVDDCDSCRELTAEAMRGTVDGAPSQPSLAGQTTRSSASAGSVLADRFELLEPLGSGAMGEVWRARDRTINRDVALKLLPEERARDAGFLARFRDELLLAREVSHPNVCRLHDLVQADGRWFLTMELIEGAPLSVIAAAGPMQADRVEHLLREIAAGLAAAHRAGVVHRDLKPGNVVVTGQDRAVVLDFGIARRDGEEGSTLVGVVVGTPRYMAPEQAATSKVDARADVYALGLIGCELLSGEVPLDRGDALPTIVARRLEDPPSVRQLAPETPARLARILDACLSREPDARPADGAAVLALLERRTELPRAPTGRRRLLLSLMAVAALVVGLALWLGGGGTSTPGTFDTRDPGSEGDLPASVEQALSLVEAGDVDRGLARLEALGREGPDRGVALLVLAGLELGYADGWLSRAPAPERGLLHAGQAVEAAPDDVEALALRALARALAGDHEGAEADAALALSRSERPPEAAILALVTSATMRARWDDASAGARRLLETEGFERHAEALALLASIDLARGAFERGQQRLTEAAERYEVDGDGEMAAETWLVLSWTCELLDQPVAATAALDRTVAADPSTGAPGGEIELARRAIEQGVSQRAGEPWELLLDWYRQRLEGTDPTAAERAELRHLELYAAWRDGNMAEVQALHRAITLSPYVETWAAFPAAEAAERAGDLSAAATHYRTLVHDPYAWEEPILTARARLGLGRALAALHRPAEARAALEAFVAAWDQAPADAPELREARRLLAGLPDAPVP